MKDPTRTFRRRGLDEDGKRLASEAYALWRDLARERGNPYSDHQYCLRAGWMAVEATRWEDGLTILAGIRRHMDEKAVPARIPEWARQEGADQRETAHNAQKAAERAERDTIVEYGGTRWIGHVPELAARDDGEIRCSVRSCGRTLADHKLADSALLRPLGGPLAQVVADARARTDMH